MSGCYNYSHQTIDSRGRVGRQALSGFDAGVGWVVQRLQRHNGFVTHARDVHLPLAAADKSRGHRLSAALNLYEQSAGGEGGKGRWGGGGLERSVDLPARNSERAI